MASSKSIQEQITASLVGTGSCSFPAPPQGKVWTGTIAIAQAMSGVSFQVLVGGLQVTSGQGSYPVGPVQAQPNQQVQVIATGMVSGTQYQVVWTIDESDQGTTDAAYPQPTSIATVASPPAVTLGTIEQLALTAGTPIGLSNVIAPVQIQTVAVDLTGANAQTAVAVNVTNTTSGVGSAPQTAFFTTGASPGPLFFPIAANPGDTLVVGLESLVNNVTFASIVIEGYGAVTQPYPLRTDGRNYPRGDFAAEAGTGGAGATLIAAPGVNRRLLLASVTMVNNGANTIVDVTATIAAAATPISYMIGGASPGLVTPNPIPPQGLLCDEDTAVLLGWAAGNAVGLALYDIVQ